VPHGGISPRDTPKSTPRGCGGRCSRPASQAGYTTSPLPRTRRPAVRARRPRRPSHDHHPATPADPGTRPAGPPRRRARPAPTPGPPPAQKGPRPPAHPARNTPTRPHRPEHPGTRSPEATLGPPGYPQPETNPKRSTQSVIDQLIDLLAESSLTDVSSHEDGCPSNRHPSPFMWILSNLATKGLG
jgi:hypothetical protein